MQKLKNVEDIVAQLKPLLRTYLEEHDTYFKDPLFTCPNREAHSNGDNTPSAGFVPETDETIFNCFTCTLSGDTFTAYSAIEGKDIQGAAWYIAVKELADRYKIHYELEPISSEEQIQVNVQTFLQALIKLSHDNLLQNLNSPAWDYLNSRGWEEVARHFTIGYVENTPVFQKFFQDQFGKYPEIAQHIPLLPSQLYGRLLYPIRHKYGIVLGLITRAISDVDEIKYRKHFLKSLERGGTLFNLTKNYKSVYLVEGASSVFTLHKHGIHNVVAMLGKTFTQQMYNALIKNGVNRVVLTFDGDEAGLAGMRDALTFTQDKSDIRILVKVLPPEKDPDDVIIEFGLEAFKEIPEVSNYKYQLLRLKDTTDETVYDNLKQSVFDIILSNKDSMVQDKMIKMFISEFNVSKTSLSEELHRYKTTKGLVADVGITEILEEQTSLIRNLETFEERAWRSGKLKGVSMGFSILDEKLDGLQPGLILIAGKWNCGKSGFMQTITLNLLSNPTNYVLYFSIDDSVIGKTLPRLIANLSMVPINVVSNPINRIDKNETLETAEKLVLKEKRTGAIDTLKQYAGRLGLKDSCDGYDTLFIEKMIKVYKSIAGERNLIVFVDFLNMVKYPKNVDRTEQETQLAGFFKHMSGLYNVPVVCTVEAGKDVAVNMREVDIKGSSSLQFRSDLTILLSSTFESDDRSDMYFYDDRGIAQPIVALRVSKNKLSAFRKTLYYKFYREFSKFEECTEEEQREFARKF